MTSVRFTDQQLTIIRLCAIECHLQQSGESSVHWMLTGWDYALQHAHVKPSMNDILTLGRLIEPELNAHGFRKVDVRVGMDIKPRPQRVPDLMRDLVAAMDKMTPAEWFKGYEDVHPWRDGNGRTGLVLFNWLAGTLDDPDWAPDFWDDWRRMPGAGAPNR